MLDSVEQHFQRKSFGGMFEGIEQHLEYIPPRVIPQNHLRTRRRSRQLPIATRCTFIHRCIRTRAEIFTGTHDANKGTMNPLVSKVHGKERRWSAEYAALRQLCLASGLNEELKWGQACYDLNGRNVVLIHGFKNYCALLFMKGALLRDPNGILIQQTKNVQAARQIRFTSVPEINKQKT